MSLDCARLAGPFATVVDVGAYVGDFARACLDAWPLCTVHSFEPLLEVANRDRARWRWYRTALGADPGVAVMNRCEFIPSSSILEMADLHRDAFPYTRRSAGQQVPVATLAQVLPSVARPALLKIDVQGYELEVLRGAGDTLAHYQAVVLEVSHAELYHGAPSPEELAGFLTAGGFQPAWRVDELRDPRTGELLQSDELWTRP